MTKKMRIKVMALAGETGADVRTVSKWMEGGAVAPVTDYALVAACHALSIKPPPRVNGADVSRGAA